MITSENVWLWLLGFGVLVALVIAGIIWLLVRSAKRHKETKPTPRPAAQEKPTLPVTPPVSVDPKRVPAYSYNDVNVYILEKTNMKSLKIGDPLELRPDPTNEYDKKAVAIYHNGILIGYLHRNRLQGMYHDFIKDGGMVTAKIAALQPEVLLKLAYYK